MRRWCVPCRIGVDAHVLHEDGDAVGQDLEVAGAMMSPAAASYGDGAMEYCPFPVDYSRSTQCCMSAGPEVDGKFSGDTHMADSTLAPNMAQSDDTVFRVGQTTTPVDPVPEHPACNVQADLDLMYGRFLHNSSLEGMDPTESWMDHMGRRDAEGVCINTGYAVDGSSMPVLLEVRGHDGGHMREMLAGVVP